MDTIGHVGVANNTTAFTLISRDNASHPFTITTNASGEAWMCVGTDSGFEAVTELYYKQVNVTFTVFTGVSDAKKEELFLYPNPTNGVLNIESGQFYANHLFQVSDLLGRVVKAGSIANSSNQIDLADLPNGVYVLRIEGNNNLTYKFIKE